MTSRIALTDDQARVCREAVELFGRRCQIIKVVEELRELADELYKAAHGGGTSLERIVDERADVAIMLYQLDEILIPSVAGLVPFRIPAKIDKLKKHMEVADGGRG